MKTTTHRHAGEEVLYIEANTLEEKEILSPFADPHNKLIAQLFSEAHTATTLLVIRKEPN